MQSNGKVKWSNFHVTVNYNIDRETHIAAMRQAVEEMVEEPYLWGWLKQYDGTSQLDFDDQTCDLIERVRLRAAFEHGGQQNRGLHVHIVIEVAHTTMVQISKQGIVKLFTDFVVGMAPNVHCRFVRGEGEDKDFILRYISKEVPRYRPVDQNNSRLKSAFSKGETTEEYEQ